LDLRQGPLYASLHREQLQRHEVSAEADLLEKLALLDKGREDNARRGEK